MQNAAPPSPATRSSASSPGATACPSTDRTAPTPPLSAAPRRSDRWISVSWGDTHQDAYQTSLDITAKDRQNLFLDVAAALSAAQVRVDSLSAKGTPDGFAVITAQLQVHSKDEINAVMRKLERRRRRHDRQPRKGVRI